MTGGAAPVLVLKTAARRERGGFMQPDNKNFEACGKHMFGVQYI